MLHRDLVTVSHKLDDPDYLALCSSVHRAIYRKGKSSLIHLVDPIFAKVIGPDDHVRLICITQSSMSVQYVNIC